MRIAINVLNALAGAGISNFLNLFPEFDKLDRKNEYFIFVSDRQTEIINSIPLGFHRKIIKNVPENPFIRVIWEQIAMPYYIFINKIDILYSRANVTNIFAPCKKVLTIENSNPYSRLKIKYSNRQAVRNKLLKYLGWLSAIMADRVVFVSNDSREKINRQLNLSSNKVVTIYPGFNNDFSNALDPKEKESYILTVGVVLPHKNIEELIRAFGVLTRKYNYNGNLIIVGDTVDLLYLKKLSKITKEINLQNRIIFKGCIPYCKIKNYYKKADVFVLPSIEETLGVPLIEAMGIGTPIAASDCDLSSENKGECFNPFKEICGDSAMYFNPFDYNDIAEVVSRVINEKGLKENMIKKGLDRVKIFPFEKPAIKLIELFNSLEH